MKTHSIKSKDITRKWYVLDASEAPLGRVSTVAARLLIGKGKPTVTSHMDGGDYVIIINSSSLIATGNKASGKVYYRHSGFPGGITKKTLNQVKTDNPQNVIIHAIRGMLPDNKLRKARLARLKVYIGSEHQHQGQNPEPVVVSKKDKN
ncbi:MAG TPA: 50S ribosomal protein L13 [Candidatus Saccharimonadales bacterium]|nr:50S ribosomal protein L13 [Candidatus Saccharimonadales bacterium]